MNRDLKIVTDWIKAPESFSPPDVLKAAVRLSSLKRGPRKSLSLPGKSRKERRDERASAYEIAKMDAAIRAGGKFVSDEDGSFTMVVAPRCEEYENGKRCMAEGTDPHHVIGGAYRRECEEIGSDGLQVLCRGHHDMRHANLPTKAYQLGQAMAHALRIGSRRLVQIVEKATARNDMKHPEARAEARKARTM